MNPEDLARRIVHSTRARSFRTNVSDWYVRPLSDLTGISPALPPEFQFSVLEGADREHLHRWLFDHHEIYPWVYFEKEIESARSWDHWYPVLLKDGAMVAFVKLARTRVHIHDFETEIALPEGVAFIYDTFVDLELRGMGLGRALIDSVSGWLSQRGYRAVFCHIEDWNKASVSTCLNAGFVRIGTVRYLRLTFFRWWLISGSLSRASGLTRWLDRAVNASAGPTGTRPAMPPLRALLSLGKRTLQNVIEIKGGIMLSMSIPNGADPSRGHRGHHVRILTTVRDGDPLERTTVLQRQDRGHVLYGLEDEGILVTYGWVASAGCKVGILHDMFLTVPRETIYIWDCLTVPGQRNRGRFHALLQGIIDRCEGIHTAYAAVDTRNDASIKALFKAGFRPLFRYYGIRLLRRPVLGISIKHWRVARAQRTFDALSGDGTVLRT